MLYSTDTYDRNRQRVKKLGGVGGLLVPTFDDEHLLSLDRIVVEDMTHVRIHANFLPSAPLAECRLKGWDSAIEENATRSSNVRFMTPRGHFSAEAKKLVAVADSPAKILVKNVDLAGSLRSAAKNEIVVTSPIRRTYSDGSPFEQQIQAYSGLRRRAISSGVGTERNDCLHDRTLEMDASSEQVGDSRRDPVADGGIATAFLQP